MATPDIDRARAARTLFANVAIGAGHPDHPILSGQEPNADSPTFEAMLLACCRAVNAEDQQGRQALDAVAARAAEFDRRVRANTLSRFVAAVGRDLEAAAPYMARHPELSTRWKAVRDGAQGQELHRVLGDVVKVLEDVAGKRSSIAPVVGAKSPAAADVVDTIDSIRAKAFELRHFEAINACDFLIAVALGHKTDYRSFEVSLTAVRRFVGQQPQPIAESTPAPQTAASSRITSIPMRPDDRPERRRSSGRPIP